MSNVMVLTEKDLRMAIHREEEVTLDRFPKRLARRAKNCDFILFARGREIVVLKSRTGVSGLCTIVKWVDSHSRWLSLAKPV